MNDDEEDDNPIAKKLRNIKSTFNRFHVPAKPKQVSVNSPLEIA